MDLILSENFKYACIPNYAVCCKDWDIDVDDETYKKLASVNREQFSKRFRDR